MKPAKYILIIVTILIIAFVALFGYMKIKNDSSKNKIDGIQNNDTSKENQSKNTKNNANTDKSDPATNKTDSTNNDNDTDKVKGTPNEQNKEAPVNEEGGNRLEGVKADNVYAEEVVSNFERLLPQIISYKDMDFTLLDTVLDKNSKFYNELKGYVENERKAGTVITMNNFSVEQVTKLNNNTYNVYVNENLYISGKEVIKYWCYRVSDVNSRITINTRTTWNK